MKRKIYNKVVISMDTLETVYEESQEYEGDIAECKGGGSGGVDKAYNARMAAISELALGQSMMAENERKYGFRPGGFVADMDKKLYAKDSNGAAYLNTDAYKKPEEAATQSATTPVTSSKYMQQQINIGNTPSGIPEWYKIEEDPNWAGGA